MAFEGNTTDNSQIWSWEGGGGGVNPISLGSTLMHVSTRKKIGALGGRSRKRLPKVSFQILVGVLLTPAIFFFQGLSGRHLCSAPAGHTASRSGSVSTLMQPRWLCTCWQLLLRSLRTGILGFFLMVSLVCQLRHLHLQLLLRATFSPTSLLAC